MYRGNYRAFCIAWIAAALLLLLAGCSQERSSVLTGYDSPVAEDQNSTPLYKGPGGNNGGGGGGTIFPLQASAISKFSNGTYNGTSVNIPAASFFKFENGALTPPAGTPLGADVEITMEVDLVKYKGDNYLEFTFGPSGCQFSPNATVTLDWSLLEFFNITLYYIDGNNYIPMAPDEIDIINKKVTIYINHFSRYALSKG